MTISKLLCSLPSQTFRAMQLHAPDTEITEIMMLLPQQRDFQENCLYVGVGNFSQLPEGSGFNILLWSWDGALPDGGNIAVLSDPSMGPVLFNQLQGSLLKRQQMTAIFNGLISGPLTGEELQNLVDQAAGLLGNPIFLVGTDHRFLAACPMVEAGEGSVYAARTRADLAAGIVGDEGVTLMEHNGISRRAADNSAPFVYYNAYLERTAVMTSIRVGTIEAATLAMIEVRSPFSMDNLDCFGELAKIIAREMQKNEYFLQNADRKAGYFLGQLLDDPQPVPAMVTRQLSRLHFSPKARFFVAVFQFPSDPAPGVRYDVLENQLRSILYNTMQITYQRRFVILFTRGEGEELGDYVLNMLRTQAEANHLAVGISNAFHGLAEVRRYYQQALEAIRFGLRIPKENTYRPLFFYQDYAFIAMLELCRQQTDLMNFCSPMLLLLLEHDRKNDADLMNTLFEYLENAENMQKTAAALYIHKNTLAYRMNRIREIMGNDLSGSWDKFLLLLSYRILMYLGIYRPERSKLAWKEQERIEQRQAETLSEK